MGSTDQDRAVTDSPTGWVARHIREYVETKRVIPVVIIERADD
ncbi:MAG TPA: hypothetical protein VHO00_08195 [Actinomycetes bacterium]|jgi:hypothetical protein|nr:hypothetical protein [Actinomycetes bacterium]